MAENKKSFIAYCEWLEVFDELEDAEAGKLIKHLLKYVNDLNPTTDDKLVKMCFIPIKQSLKRDLVKYEVYIDKQRENGAKGGAKKGNQNAKKTTQTTQTTQRLKKQPKQADNVNVNDNDINNIYIKFVDEVKNGGYDTRVESLYMRLKLKPNSLTPLLKDFKLHIIEENRIHKDTNDFFINFKNWLNTQDRINKLDKYR